MDNTNEIKWGKLFAQSMGTADADADPCSSWKIKYCLRGDSLDGIHLELDGEVKSFHDLMAMAEGTCNQCSDETKANAELLRDKVAAISPEVAMCMVPPCVFRGGCPRTDTSCKLYDFLCQTDERFFRTNLVERYNAYHEWRESRKTK